MEGTNLKNVEKAIQISISPDKDMNEEAIEQACRYTRQLRSSIQGLTLILQNIPNFLSPTSFQYAFMIITYWCQEKSEQITTELWSSIRLNVFNFALSHYSNFEPDTTATLSDAQAIVALRSYLNNPSDPSPFNIILGQPLLISSRFLNSLFKFLTTPIPKFLSLFSNFKTKSIQDGLLPRIQEYIIGQLSSNSPDLFLAFSGLTKWTDCSWAKNQKIISLLMSKFSDISTRASIAEIFSKLLLRLPDDRSRTSLFQNLRLIEQIQSVFQTQPDFPTSLSFARLISTAGRLMLNPLSPDSPDLEQLSTSLFQLSLQVIQIYSPPLKGTFSELSQIESSYEKIISLLLPFVDSYISLPSHVESAPQTFQIIMNRLKLSFNAQSVNYLKKKRSVFEKGYKNQFTHLLYLCYSQNPSGCFSIIQTYGQLQSLILENPSLTAALLAFLNDACDSSLKDMNLISTFIGSFASLLDLEPSIYATKRVLYCAAYYYINLPTVISKFPFNNDSYQDRFDLLLSFIKDETIEDAIHDAFSAQLAILSPIFSLRLSPDAKFIEDINSLLNQISVSCSIAAANLLKKLPDKIPRIIQSLAHFRHLISTDENPRSACLCGLAFISAIQQNQLHNELLQNMLNFITSAASIACSEHFDDQLFAMTIKSLSSLGVFGYSTLLEFCSHELGLRSLGAAAYTAREIYQASNISSSAAKKQEPVSIVLEGSWLIKLDSILVEGLQNLIQKSINDCCIGNELNPLIETTIQCLSLFGTAPQALSASAEPLIKMLLSLMENYYDNARLFEGIISFLTDLAQKSTESPEAKENLTRLITMLIKPSLFCLFVDDFDPSITKWRRVMLRIFTFHLTLIQLGLPDLKPALAEAFQMFGGSPELVDGYLELLGGASADNSSVVVNQGSRFFLQILRFKRTVL